MKTTDKKVTVYINGQFVECHESEVKNVKHPVCAMICGYLVNNSQEALDNMIIVVDGMDVFVQYKNASAYRLPCAAYHKSLDVLDKEWKKKDLDAYNALTGMTCIEALNYANINRDPYIVARVQYKVSAAIEEGKESPVLWDMFINLKEDIRESWNSESDNDRIFFYLTD